MKAKRIAVSALMAAVCALSLAITAFALDSGTITKNNVTLNGTVSGFRFAGVLIDQINYSGTISGSGVNNIPAGSEVIYVQAGYDNHLFDKQYLTKDYQGVQENNKWCAPFVDQVNLIMYNQGTYDILTSYLAS